MKSTMKADKRHDWSASGHKIRLDSHNMVFKSEQHSFLKLKTQQQHKRLYELKFLIVNLLGTDPHGKYAGVLVVLFSHFFIFS